MASGVTRIAVGTVVGKRTGGSHGGARSRPPRAGRAHPGTRRLPPPDRELAHDVPDDGSHGHAHLGGRDHDGPPPDRWGQHGHVLRRRSATSPLAQGASRHRPGSLRGGDAGGVRFWHPMPERLLGEGALRIQDAARQEGFDRNPASQFIDPELCDGSCPKCMIGCAKGAKWTARSYVEEALAAGAKLRTRAKVEEGLSAAGASPACGQRSVGPLRGAGGYRRPCRRRDRDSGHHAGIRLCRCRPGLLHRPASAHDGDLAMAGIVPRHPHDLRHDRPGGRGHHHDRRHRSVAALLLRPCHGRAA